MKQILLYLAFFCCKDSFGQKITKSHISKQPYTKYVLSDPDHKDSITFYLSEFSKGSPLPLIIYIQGSGNSSLFLKDSIGKIIPRAGHISLTYAVKEKAKVLIIEKPGVNFLDSKEENVRFDKQFSPETRSSRIVKVIRFIIGTEKIDVSKIMLIGHSEGGLVAARVAKLLNGIISNVAILAGEGPSQLYSLYSFAESGDFFGLPNTTRVQRIDSLNKTREKILSNPKSVT